MTMKNGMGHGFFITGTDTGIGKTYVARLLLEGLAAARQTVTYMKPVQTGCTCDAEGNLVAPDFDYVMKNGAYMSAEMEDHVPYRFEPACSPHLAASLAGVTISLEYIREKFSRVSDKKSIAIVEGAGGIFRNNHHARPHAAPAAAGRGGHVATHRNTQPHAAHLRGAC